MVSSASIDTEVSNDLPILVMPGVGDVPPATLWQDLQKVWVGARQDTLSAIKCEGFCRQCKKACYLQ